jgi:hypothetical protein
MNINVSRLDDKELKALYAEARVELSRRKSIYSKNDFISRNGLERFVKRMEAVNEVREFAVAGTLYRLGWTQGMKCDIVCRPLYEPADFADAKLKNCPLSIQNKAVAYNRKITDLCDSFSKWCRKKGFDKSKELELFDILGSHLGFDDAIQRLYGQ